jgi:hypothetical protein
MVPFSYWMDGDDSWIAAQEADGDAVLVGNSATAEGNHVDVFLRLHAFGIANAIVAPLNYGDPRYAAIVRQRGRSLFGTRFRSLDAFLPFESYREELRHCRYVVMGHLRQQAVGNVVLALSMGAKVFFLAGSPVHAFLSRQGARVFLLDEATAQDFGRALDSEAVAANRGVVRRIWGRDAILRRTQRLVAALDTGCAPPPAGFVGDEA